MEWAHLVPAPTAKQVRMGSSPPVAGRMGMAGNTRLARGLGPAMAWRNTPHLLPVSLGYHHPPATGQRGTVWAMSVGPPSTAWALMVMGHNTSLPPNQWDRGGGGVWGGAPPPGNYQVQKVSHLY